MTAEQLPKFFRVRQTFPRPRVENLAARVLSELGAVCPAPLQDRTVAITVGSRGVAGIAHIVRACVEFLQARVLTLLSFRPWVVTAVRRLKGNYRYWRSWK